MIRTVQVFGTLAATFFIASVFVLEAGTAHYERQCAQAGRTTTECKLLARGR